MDINAIIADMAAGIADSAVIATWADTTYSQACAVYENCDPRQAPPQSACPLVIVYHLAKAGGLNRNKKSVAIGVACWVYDSEKPVSDEGVTRYDGVRNVEALRALVLAEVVDHLPANIALEDMDAEFNPHMDFPLVGVDMTLTITQEKLIGQTPYE